MKFQDILDTIKEHIYNCLKRSKSVFPDLVSTKVSSNFSKNRLASIESDTKLSNATSLNSVHRRSSPTKNSNNSSDYSDHYSRFYEESSQISNKFHLHNHLGFIRKPTLELSSKVDEVKSLIAAKEREDQAQAVEYRKRVERTLAQKETMKTLERQMTEKLHRQNRERNEDVAYGQQLEDRRRFMEKMQNDQNERNKQVQLAYSKVLHEQMSQRNDEKEIMQQLENTGKKIITPEPIDSGRFSPYRNSPISLRSQVLIPNRSNLKYLAQYGNLVINNGTK